MALGVNKFTQDDVRAASYALTGYSVNVLTGACEFQAISALFKARHDSGNARVTQRRDPRRTLRLETRKRKIHS